MPTQPRTPLIAADHNYLRLENKSPFTRTFEVAFEEAFQEAILPDALSHPTFEHGRAPFYVSDREWLVDEQSKNPTEPYEDYLDHHFWYDPQHRITFLLGDVGCGKSTLLDYYLRCFCPKFGALKDEYYKHLILNINFRGVPSVAEFDRRLYQHAKHLILNKLPTIESDDDHLMWDPRLNWTSVDIRLGSGGRPLAEYRADLVNSTAVQIS